MEWVAVSNSPAELGTQQSSLFPVAIAFLWGPDDLLRSDALATFLNCTAPSQETNISVINQEVPRAGLNTPAFFLAKCSQFSRKGLKVTEGLDSLYQVATKLMKPWMSLTRQGAQQLRTPLSPLSVEQTMPRSWGQLQKTNVQV